MHGTRLYEKQLASYHKGHKMKEPTYSEGFKDGHKLGSTYNEVHAKNSLRYTTMVTAMLAEGCGMKLTETQLILRNNLMISAPTTLEEINNAVDKALDGVRIERNNYERY